MTLELCKIKNYYKKFCLDRDWLSFHSPKNLSMALNVESSELLEIFQWLTEKQSIDIKNDTKILESVKDELSDILLYLIRIADVLDIDLNEAVQQKTKKIEKKYTIEKGKELSLKFQKIGS